MKYLQVKSSQEEMRMLETRWRPWKPSAKRKSLGPSNHGMAQQMAHKKRPDFLSRSRKFCGTMTFYNPAGHSLRWLTLCAVSANCWALFFMSSVFSSARPNRSPRSFKAWLAFCTALVTLSAAEWRMLFPGRIARVSRVGLSNPQWQIPTLWRGQSPSSWTQLTWWQGPYLLSHLSVILTLWDKYLTV